MTIPDIIKSMSETTKRNEKIAILEEHKDNAHLKSVLYAAIDPYVTFFITEIPITASEEVRENIVENIPVPEEYMEEAIVSLLRHAMNTSDRKMIKDMFFTMASIADGNQDYTNLIEAILKKDLSAGFSAATVNSVWPGLINEFKVMKASEEKLITNITYPAQCDLKMDGVAGFAIYKNGSVEVKSSSGKVFLKLPTIEQAVTEFGDRIDGYYDGFVVCGEVIAHDANGNRLPRQVSNGIAYKALLGTISDEVEQSLHFYAYDLLSSSGQLERGVDPKPLQDRLVEFAYIDDNSNMIRVPSAEVESHEHAMEVFNQFVAEGEEGIILKNMNSVYESKRSKDWVKVKKQIEVDVRIIAWTPHKKKEGQLGSMTVTLDDRAIIGNIGTKLSDQQRKDMFRMAEKGDLVGMVATITCHEITYSKTKKTHSFYLPRFDGFRWDKEETDSFDKVMSM